MSLPVVEERIVRLLLNGVEDWQWRCTPNDVEALAVGSLFIRGLITQADDAALTVENAVDMTTVAARIPERRTVRVYTRGGVPIPETDTFIELFRELFSRVDARHEHGGMHAAAAFDGAALVAHVDDVGRHNTIDKIVGALLLAGQSPERFGLLTSSRVSGEIADKAARAGFAWLASRSIPTTLAVQIASAAHLPIIGRAPSRDAHVYS